MSNKEEFKTLYSYAREMYNDAAAIDLQLLKIVCKLVFENQYDYKIHASSKGLRSRLYNYFENKQNPEVVYPRPKKRRVIIKGIKGHLMNLRSK